MENDDVESEEEDDTEDADAEEEDRSQDRTACFVRACAVEMHFNISQEPMCTGIYRKTTAPQIEPRMHTHTHTHLLAHFVRACAVEMHVNTSHAPLYTDIAGKMPRPRLRPERRYTLCASLRSRSACQHFTKATLYGHLQENAAAQKRDPHFVRACAVEMLVNISQESLHTEVYRKNAAAQKRDPHFVRACAVEMLVNISQESLHTEVYRKNAAAQNWDPHFVRACSRHACQHFTRVTSYGSLQEKCRGPEPGPALCASLQSKCMSTFHKSHFIRTFAGKMPRPRSGTRTLCEPARSKCWSTFHKSHFIYGSLQEKCRGPKAGPALCASLRGRNAGQHFTRVTSYGSLQEKCRGPEPGPALCASLQSKCMSTFHKSHFIRKFTGKMPRPRTGTRTLCELAVEILYFAHLAIRLQMIRVSSIRSSQIDWAEVVVITKLFLDRDWRQF